MKEEISLTIREVQTDDALQLLTLLPELGRETEFLLLSEGNTAFTEEQERAHLQEKIDAPNNLALVAINQEKIIGIGTIAASSNKKIQHIGDLSISISKAYWGFGIGSVLMEELIDWARQSGIIRRLELTVQEDNVRAIHLYDKFGFQTEALMERGCFVRNQFIPVRLMSMLID